MVDVSKFAKPALECDIVMKGGITSGVVYPGAVDELARRYRFRSIGGTSAGAIAAAIVAAAEHARQHGDPSGFAAVADLPVQLAEEVKGRSLLLRLFQPDAETAPLFDVALGFLGGPLAGAWTAVRRFSTFPIVGLVLALAALALTLFAGVDPAFAVGGIALGLLIAPVGLVVQLVRAALRVADHHFGLCRLGPKSVGGPGEPALTAWLHERIQTISGGTVGGPVLTFADLWGAGGGQDPGARVAEQQAFSKDPRRRVVDLQMMTTDLTHGRPWRLPVPYQPHAQTLDDVDAGKLLFDPEELAEFFPPDVIAHLCERGGDPDTTAATLATAVPGRTLKCFPIGPDLPVLVATRMSLSFPILIAAIPLYELEYFPKPDDETAAPAPELRRIFFSDGGISSNFPVHFFDSPLPTRPTFALHLTGFTTGGPDPDHPCRAVSGPSAATDEAPQPMAQFTSLLGFLTAIKDAAQNWRDNSQAQLPGFRDRVVHIRLAPKEGGLNLTMKRQKVIELSARGACAGRALIEQFAGPEQPGGGEADTQHWKEHRFVRFRVAMSLTERHLEGFEHGFSFAFGAGNDYPSLIAQHETAPPYPFETEARTTFAETRAQEYVKLSEDDETLDDRRIPRPPSTLRMVPPV
jgi:predicted acylesterase/phospholipase RssA